MKRMIDEEKVGLNVKPEDTRMRAKDSIPSAMVPRISTFHNSIVHP